jgi:hypothetical protein
MHKTDLKQWTARCCQHNGLVGVLQWVLHTTASAQQKTATMPFVLLKRFRSCAATFQQQQVL